MKFSLLHIDTGGAKWIALGVRELDLFHSIAIGSKGNGQDFILHVQKESVESRQDAEFNKYGLATNQLLKGTVPDLSNIRW